MQSYYTPVGKRRKSSEFDIESDDSESIFANKAQDNTRSKSKETFVVLVTVLLLLVLGFFALGYMYYNESIARQALVLESNKNYEILKACDRFDLMDVDSLKSRISGKTALAIQSSATCKPCKKCHNYAQPKGPNELRTEKTYKEVEKLKALLPPRIARNARIEDSIQRVSKELFQLKYDGSSSISVEMSVKVPSVAALSVLSFDMHDVGAMPYSMLHFVSQISAGLWDGCSITTYYSTHSMLIAEARGNNCNAKAFKEVPFLDETLLFSEYNSVAAGETVQKPDVPNLYPHDRAYCLSISTQLKVPNFYIVMPSSNTIPSGLRGAAGPNGGAAGEEAVDYYQHSTHHGLINSSDICIGKLNSKSFPTLDMLLKLAVRGGAPSDEDKTLLSSGTVPVTSRFAFEKPATITRARVRS